MPSLFLPVCHASIFAMHFATFASHSPPPMVTKSLFKPMSDLFSFASPASNETMVGYVGYVSPTALSPCCTLACWEEDEDRVHYFRYTPSNSLMRSMWDAHHSSSVDSPRPMMSHLQKAVVFAKMRRWYANQSNANLSLQVHGEEDRISWTLSTLFLWEGEEGGGEAIHMV